MRPYKDIIHPMLYDYSNRVAQVGFNTFDPFEIAYLNDFVIYLNEIIPHGNFAFYPLRKKQNVGQGRTGIGMGKMASGNPIIFNSNASWGDSGVYMDSINNCGVIDFANLEFQFRRDNSTILYVFKHERGENEEVLYQPGVKTPYFCFDRGDNVCADHFTIYAPEFSNDPRRPIGTTYIYDEIFGLDKKGYAFDYSIPPSELAAENQGYSFYSLKNNFVTLNLCTSFDNYLLRSFSGVDDTVLTGKFREPYLSYFEEELDSELTGVYYPNPNYNPNSSDPRFTNPGYVSFEEPTGKLVKKFLMPTRMILGAGVANDGYTYSIAGLPQTCAGILIISGNYCNLSDQINNKLLTALDIKRKPDDYFEKFVENIQVGGNITSIIYKDNPLPLDQISDKFLFIPSIEKAVYRSIFDFYYELIGNTGSLLAPVERFYTSGLVNAIVYIALTDSFTGSDSGRYGVSGIETINKELFYHPQETGGIYGVSGIEKINWGLPAILAEEFNLSASGILDDINIDSFNLSASGFIPDTFYLDTGIFGGASGISSIDYNQQIDTGIFGGASGIEPIITGPTGFPETLSVTSSGNIDTENLEIFGLTSSGNIDTENLEIFGLTASGSINVI